MAEIASLEKVLWAVTVFLQAGLLVLLLYRKNHKAFPFFSAYVLLTLAQNAVFFASYRRWGFNSPASVRIAWGTQAVVIFARGLAVAEICRRFLARYRGIWALAWRMLFATAALVLLYSLAVARGRWQFAVINADRGIELAIAVTVVTLFLFVQYYEVAIESVVRSVITGFFLYSCFFVLNDTILEGWIDGYTTLWNLLGTVAFLASLLLWIWALRETQPEATSEPEMLSEGVYRKLAPEINLRLKALNEHLGQFWCAGVKRP